MKAVILVGGEGTRLRPLTCNMPKPVVPIVNRPFLEHTIDYLRQHHIEDIILALCYLPGPIQSYFGDGSGWGVRLTYVVESSPLGTAGAVKNVASHLDDTFFVLNGDVFADLDLTAMLAHHRGEKAKISIALTPVDDPTIYGVVETATSGRVQRFVEKPSWDAVTTNMINAGTYILEPEVLEYIPARTHYMFEHGLFPLLVGRGEPVYGYPSDSYWIDIGTPEKYLELHHDLLSGRSARSLAGQTGGTATEEGCHIHPTAQVGRKVIIGRNCTIARGAQVTGPSVLGQGCRIGEGAVLEGAVLWHNASLGAGVRARNCIIAANTEVGDHCSLMDNCVLGDNVVIGEGSQLGRGIRVWPGERLEPGTISR